jgi:hypothetical protein
MMARRSLTSDEFQYRRRRPLLRVAPFLRPPEDGENRENLEGSQRIRRELAHEFAHFPDCILAQQPFGHIVNPGAVARIL